jgi:hypothetical protein
VARCIVEPHRRPAAHLGIYSRALKTQGDFAKRQSATPRTELLPWACVSQASDQQNLMQITKRGGIEIRDPYSKHVTTSLML